MNCPVLVTKPRAAELIKYTSNALLATKISFINEIARLCEKLGVSVEEVARGVALDRRIGPHFLRAGIGFGGSCFPKDTAALLDVAKQHNATVEIVEKAIHVNQTQYVYFLENARKILRTFRHKRLAIFGLSFKPGTDDLRESRALLLIQKLLAEGAYVSVHDPVAKLPPALHSSNIVQHDTAQRTAAHAHAIIICTEWPQYEQLDWQKIRKTMETAYVFDGRNMLDGEAMRAIGFYYRGIG